jgi:DNA mismatch endonuclease (patch repair protein)
VHGCFWHSHEGCKYASKPSTNTDYWNSKFERNKARDKRVRDELEAAGWQVVVIWECELKKDQLPHTEKRLYEIMSLTERAK